jgi:hypothetical protein
MRLGKGYDDEGGGSILQEFGFTIHTCPFREEAKERVG